MAASSLSRRFRCISASSIVYIIAQAVFSTRLCDIIKLVLLGIDEVGRGPWAGPLVMGACILNDDPREEWQESLTDSKKLTAKRREELEPIILEKAAATGLGWVSAEELDALGMSEALRIACRRAVENVRKAKVPFKEIIIDGTVNFLAGTTLEKYVSTLKKADLLIKEVSAASIIAKVARDRYMIKLTEKYPEYGFEKHVGYGTKLHREKLENYGVCPEHRRSFRPVAKVLGSPISSRPKASSLSSSKSSDQNDFSGGSEIATSTTYTGQRAERAVAEYLAGIGHRVIGRNYRTKRYEIDVISVKDEVIYFTEVKYRKNYEHGSPLEMIGREKLRQMKFAAKAFMHQKARLVGGLRPKLAVAAVVGENYRVVDWFGLEVE